MSLINHEEKRNLEALRAVLMLAASNFPRSTDVEIEIKAAGANHGSVTIPYYVLLKLIEPRP